MRVCADFENQLSALNAHKHLIDEGIDPGDIEIRSPYPLAEHPIPAHRSYPMRIRTVVRCMWALAVCLGFSFVSFTQYEWAPVSVTNGHPLIPPPITMLVTYECGMFTAIWTTTFMFFLETYRFRSLVPPLEEDMPVAIGYIVLIVAGRSADRALKLFEGRGARSVVSYGLMALLLMGSLPGCARFNMREQDVIKSTEAPANAPGTHSMKMPSVEDLQNPSPLGPMTFGDVPLYSRYKSLEAKRGRLGRDSDAEKKAGHQAESDKLAAEKTAVDDQMKVVDAEIKAFSDEPKMYTLKKLNAPPATIANWKNPIKPTTDDLARGKVLFEQNCSACHGKTGQGDGKVGNVEYIQPPKIGDGATYSKIADSYFYYFIFTGKNLMPSFGYKLTNDEICHIILHLRQLQSGAASAAAPINGADASAAATPSAADSATPAPVASPALDTTPSATMTP